MALNVTFPLLPLLAWFLKNKRLFPWRQNTTPYAVWISEVMLQQTQASVVIDYYKRWMQRFPTIQALASASQEEVIKLWEGLGYYSRARNIHTAARALVDHYGGFIPDTQKELLKIKGLGPYTEAAIRSFSFHQKAAAVDGNVERVLSRYFLIEEDILKAQTKKKIRDLTFKLLPDEKPWIAMEALIELGALICQKKPDCQRCPLNQDCLANHSQKAALLPYKSKKTVLEKLYREVAVIFKEDAILIKKGEPGKVMADLFEFPFLTSKLGGLDPKTASKQFSESIDLELKWIESLPSKKHSFTRFDVMLYPHIFHAKEESTPISHQWVKKEEIHKFPFSSGHRRILQELGYAFIAH